MKNILKQNIVKDLGLDTLPVEKQEEVLLRVGKIVFQNVIMRVLDELNEKDKSEFDKLLSERPDDEEAILSFLQSHISNIDGIVEEEITKFKEESLNVMQNTSS